MIDKNIPVTVAPWVEGECAEVDVGGEGRFARGRSQNVCAIVWARNGKIDHLVDAPRTKKRRIDHVGPMVSSQPWKAERNTAESEGGQGKSIGNP